MARLYAIDEMRTGSGGGVVETWYAPDGDEPEYKELELIGFSCGHFVLSDGSTGTFNPETYNHRYGMRVWTSEPSEWAREKTPWED